MIYFLQITKPKDTAKLNIAIYICKAQVTLKISKFHYVNKSFQLTTRGNLKQKNYYIKAYLQQNQKKKNS